MKADDVPVYNSSKKSWKIIDYLEYYCDKGVHEYRVFSGFMKTYNFTCGTALSIVYGQSGGYTTQLFRDGELRIVDRLIEVQRLADKIMKCGKYTPFDLGRSFVLAMLDIFTHPDYKHQTMLRKMKMRQGQMHSCASKHEYLRLLEKVYNYKNTEKLRFI